MMEPLIQIESHAVLLPQENIDTDQITPARFLRTVSRAGMKAVLFVDWRKDPGFALNLPGADTAKVLVAGDNFGCGSSREHAPWALADWGFRVVISSSFADIFKSNCVKNGILTAAVTPDALLGIFAAIQADPTTTIAVDVAAQTITIAGAPVAHFELDGFSRRCLLEGLDELGYLLSHEAAIKAHEEGEIL